MAHAVIAGFVRSPFTPVRKGGLAGIRPDDLAAVVVRALVGRSGIDPAAIEDLILGCAFPEGEQGMNVARAVAFAAGLPHTCAAVTVNRLCGSSMQAIHDAAGRIALGAGEAFVCVGVESMSRMPRGGANPQPNPDLQKHYPGLFLSMGATAELVARQWQIDRADQDRFALKSHRNAIAAAADGGFADELVPVLTAHGLVEADGCLRADTDEAKMAALQPAFAGEDGTVTAGNSSPLSDGAAAVLVTSEQFAQRSGLQPMARVAATAVAGCPPELMGIGPVEATRKALGRAGIEVSQLGVVELNEAFAAQALACSRELGLAAGQVNLHGGAIALGHPLGATGARLVGKAASLLTQKGIRYALATQCIGGGQGIATVLERLR